MTFAHQTRVILQNLLGTPHLWLLALDFERVAIEQARAQIQFGFKQPDVFVTSTKKGLYAARDLNTRLH